MQNVLKFLTAPDVRELQNKMQLARIQPGQFLIREGKPPVGIFIIRKGTAEVRRAVHDREIVVAEVGENELLGETAFLRPTSATASVVAKTVVEALVFTPERMGPLFESDPGIFGRFFHSLAFVISKRLRAMNEQAGGDPIAERFGELPDWELI